MGLSRKQVVLNRLQKFNPYHTVKMVREDRTAWKTSYFQRIEKLIEEYPTCFLVSADNVSSKQMQQIRIALRGKGEVLMGKNTMMRKAIRGQLSKYPHWRNFFRVLLAMLDLSSPMRICVKFETSFLATKKRLLPRLVPLLPLMSLYQVATQDKVLRRPPSFRLWLSQPRLRREPLKF